MEMMRAQKGKSLLIAGGVVAMIIIAAIAALLLFGINTFKSTIESTVFDATGLKVSIKGKKHHGTTIRIVIPKNKMT